MSLSFILLGTKFHFQILESKILTNKYYSHQIISVFIGILPWVRSSDLMHPTKIHSKATVHALENILDRFYTKRTSIVFIAVHSSRTGNNGLKPIDVAGEVIRIESYRTSKRLTYVIEKHVTVNQAYQRFNNVFLVDSYDSFRQVFVQYQFNPMHNMLMLVQAHFHWNNCRHL